MTETILNQLSSMQFYGMVKAYQNLLDSNQHHQLTNDELLNLLIQAEWEDRQNRKIKRYLKAARFRYQASVEQVNFIAQRGLEKTHFLRMSECRFIEQKENLLITGATGVGKSYLATALGNQACLQGLKTLYFNTQKLFPQLKMCKADGTYHKRLRKIEQQDLLILDDFGLQSLDNNSRMIIMEIIEDRHGRKSTIIASQLPVSKWYEVIGESTIADAILDRMAHTAHRIELKGESMRKTKKKTSEKS